MGCQLIIEYHLINLFLIAHPGHIQVAYDAAENQRYQKPGGCRYENDTIDLAGHHTHRNDRKHIPVVIAQRFIGKIAVFSIHRLEFHNTAFLLFQFFHIEFIIEAQLVEIVHRLAGGFTVGIEDDISILIPDGTKALAVIDFHQQLICQVLCPACRKQNIANAAILGANRSGKYIEIIPADFIMQSIGKGRPSLQSLLKIFPIPYIKLHSIRCQAVPFFIGNAIPHEFTISTGAHQGMKQLFRIRGMLILQHIGNILQC